jgi:hypothetical protein
VCEELQSPLIIQCYEPNLECRGFDCAGQLIRFLAAETTIPLAIALDHGSRPSCVPSGPKVRRRRSADGRGPPPGTGVPAWLHDITFIYGQYIKTVFVLCFGPALK